MGIRVHKVMGWGLTDVKTRKGHLADSRINSKSMAFDPYDEKFKAMDYLAWLKAKYDNALTGPTMDMWLIPDDEGNPGGWSNQAELDSIKKVLAYDLFHWGSEHLLSNVLCITPLVMHNQWHRFDDPMDWVEETHFRDSDQLNRVDIIPGGIFPWQGLYMDARNGNPIKGVEADLWRIAHWSNPPEFEACHAVAKALEFDSVEQAEEMIVPQVPQEIRELCEYTKIFKQADVWLQLKPMIYTFWR